MSIMIHRNRRKKSVKDKQEKQMQENVPVQFSETELQEMSSEEIKKLAQESGFKLPPSPPASKEKIISAFMEQQETK